MGAKTNFKCLAAFVLGVLAVAYCVVAVARPANFYILAAMLLLTLAAVTMGILGWREVSRQAVSLRGKALAGVGIALPVLSICLATALLPHV